MTDCTETYTDPEPIEGIPDEEREATLRTFKSSRHIVNAMAENFEELGFKPDETGYVPKGYATWEQLTTAERAEIGSYLVQSGFLPQMSAFLAGAFEENTEKAKAEG